ncbi:MAG: tetratricopeptide repeat protein, partial [Bacteroides sp.]|nr:tetratricopeptide repeat protein [Bacteroides sp.]
MKSIVLHYTGLLLFLYTFLFSCTHKQDQTLLPELILAESMMYQCPDSAQLILEQMDVPFPSDPLQHVTWSLLLTQARYKNYVTQDSDSLINIAYDY